MESLEATATLRWEGYRGRIEGGSGALSVATATQAELGGPGGESNPEELFSAALANCFTSTLTAMSAAALHARVASPAPEAEVLMLIADAERHCPVCQAISGRVVLSVTADVVGA